MSGWSNPDVTPVGGAPGAAPPGPVPAYGPPQDPFGSRPTVRRRRPLLIGLGVLLLVGGVVAFVVGLLATIDAGSDVTGRAVARGEVGEGESTAATFVADGGEPYTIHLHFGGGIVSDEEEEDATVGDTVCEVRHPDGRTSTIRGDRQGTSVSIGSASTVGWFTAQDLEGETTVACAYEQGSRFSRRNRAGGVQVLVTPGKPSDSVGGFVALFAGIAVALLGGLALFKGLMGRRVPVG